MIDPAHAVQAAFPGSHRLAPPILLFCICSGILVAVSHSIWTKPAPCSAATAGGGISGPIVTLSSSVRVYLVPLLKRSSLSTDGLTVTVSLTGAEGLLMDVASGRVDTLLLGGTTWTALPGPTNDALVLTSHTVPCCPVKVLASDKPTWTTDWAVTGSGVLILAFKDLGNAAS